MTTILIVEDEPSIAEIISFALSSEGLLAQSCATAADALTKLENNAFDLIILDIGLPDMNGFELAKHIRNYSQIPIIFLTARANEIDRVVGLELGGDDYVTKPFSPRELSARVKAVLRRSGANSAPEQAAQIQSCSAFEIDEEKIQISYQQQNLELSRTEYRLLKLLVQSPGRVYTRDQLMHHAWEHAEVSMDRTVDTHIKTIRQKLKTIDPDYDPIITHRGIGYALREG